MINIGDTVEVLEGLRTGELAEVLKVEKVGTSSYYTVKFEDGSRGVFAGHELELL